MDFFFYESTFSKDCSKTSTVAASSFWPKRAQGRVPNLAPGERRDGLEVKNADTP
jgi:hypothetical protein